MNIVEKFPLERSLRTKDANAFEKILKKANETHVLRYTKSKGVRTKYGQYWDFYVHCPTINFADAYARVGFLWAEYIFKKRKYNES